MTVSTPPFLDDPRPVSRRRALLLAAAALLLPPMRAAAQAVGSRGPGGTVAHPDPRPGVTAGAVLPPERVPEQAKEAYDAARAIPEVLDGLYCHCDCAGRHDELRSLLSCFEGTMPIGCGICQGEAKMAWRMSREGKSLQEIREAIDNTYG
jgi:hypothetical protein